MQQDRKLPLPETGSNDKLIWEKRLWPEYPYLAGCDEVGRGSWAGPVVAAAVVFEPGLVVPGVDDSKKLSPQKREELFEIICNCALDFAIGMVSPEVIDEINILEASFAAMRMAVTGLKKKPDHILVDGNRGMGTNIPQTLLIKGDSLSQSIGAASIIAKVTRDRLMCEMEKTYPAFKFSIHKGYGTKRHQEELESHGVLPIHRKSYGPIKVRLNLTGCNMV